MERVNTVKRAQTKKVFNKKKFIKNITKLVSVTVTVGVSLWISASVVDILSKDNSSANKVLKVSKWNAIPKVAEILKLEGLKGYEIDIQG